MSDSERPVDLLVASLLASTPGESGEAKPEPVDGEPPEDVDRVGHALEAMAKTAEPTKQVLRTVSGPQRLDRFCDALARFFDVGEAAARALLARVDVAEEWMEGPDAGISVLPVEAGPRAQAALASLVRLPAGVTLSEHPHVGREQLFVLEGGFADSVGHVVWPGETLEMAAGTVHSMWGLPGPACVCAALLWLDDGGG
ncbi:MAG: cupin domain-containing protein [Myxococcaceae bacterium]